MQITPRTASHPTGLQITFHPEPQDYLCNGEKLTSVTTLIHKWFPQFDAEAVAKKKAEREGGSYEALLVEWARKRDDASGFGTKVHLMVDTILQEKDDRAADQLAESAREKAYLTAIKEALVRIGRGYEFVESEKIIFSPGTKVAGTLDLLLRSKSTGEYVIGDWKTNREIKYTGYRQEMGSGPCERLANCNFNHYSLQASAYGALLTSEGYIPRVESVRGVLLHLTEKNGTVVCDYVKTKNLTAESRLILSALKT
ncbi:MAG: PD-(D/E)XK nuclease family protein [Bdellovibrionales bacterium]